MQHTSRHLQYKRPRSAVCLFSAHSAPRKKLNTAKHLRKHVLFSQDFVVFLDLFRERKQRNFPDANHQVYDLEQRLCKAARGAHQCCQHHFNILRITSTTRNISTNLRLTYNNVYKNGIKIIYYSFRRFSRHSLHVRSHSPETPAVLRSHER